MGGIGRMLKFVAHIVGIHDAAGYTLKLVVVLGAGHGKACHAGKQYKYGLLSHRLVTIYGYYGAKVAHIS
jgi:hypothetical protein